MQPEPWVALLRAVNVGGTAKLPMATLREVVAGLGHADVRTYIQSGNVVFVGAIDDRAAAAAAMEAAIERAVGFRPPVVLRRGEELAAFVAGNPYLARGCDPARVHGVFYDGPPEPGAVAALEGGEWAADEVTVRGADAWLHLPEGTARSKLATAVVAKRVGRAGTIRNWRTVCTLAEWAVR